MLVNAEMKQLLPQWQQRHCQRLGLILHKIPELIVFPVMLLFLELRINFTIDVC